MARRSITQTLTLGVSIACAFVVIVLGASNFFAMGELSWSLIPIYCILLGWLVALPILWKGYRWTLVSMGVLTVLFAPFTYLVCLACDAAEGVFIIAVTFATIGMVFLWAIVLAIWFFHRRPRIVWAIIFFAGAVVSYTCTMAVSALFPDLQTSIAGWQFMGVITFVPVGAALIGVEFLRTWQRNVADREALEKKQRRKAARKGRS